MNENVRKTIKRSLAAVMALILVIGLSGWMRDAQLKADEEAPAEEVVAETPVEEVVVELPAEEPTVVVQEVELPAEEPAEEAAGRSAEAVEEAEAEAEVEEEPKAEEEPKTEATEEAEEKAPFDVREAYEHYVSLGSEAEKQAYLDSLDSADRAELEKYIAEQEPVIEAAGRSPEAVEVQAAALSPEANEEAAGRSAEAVEGEEPSEEPEEEKTEGTGDSEQVTEGTDGTDDSEQVTEEPEEEKAEEPADTSFGSALISGEWAGRSTSTARSLSIEVYVDGERADSCSSEANMSVAKFSVAIGDCTVVSESSSCASFSGSSGSYTVDMYADTFATVTIMLETPEAEEEPAAEVTGDSEQVTEDEAEGRSPEAVEEPVEELVEEEPAAEVTGDSEQVTEDEAVGRSPEAVEEVAAEPEVRKSDLLLAYEEFLNMTEEEQAEYLKGLTEKELARFDRLSELVRAEASFTVRFFDYEGRQIGEAQTVAAGTSAVAPAAPSGEGEEFTGWNADYSCVLSDLDVSPRTGDIENNRKVIISYAGGRSTFAVGEQVTIVSELIGFDDAESIGYQWQYSTDAETWNDISDGTGAEYSFTQTIETGTYFWRLLVNA